MHRNLLIIVVLILLLLPGLAGAEESARLESISAQSDKMGQWLELSFKLDRKASSFTIYQMSSPERLVVELFNTVNHIENGYISEHSNIVARTQVVETAGEGAISTRIILFMRVKADYISDISGNKIILKLFPMPGSKEDEMLLAMGEAEQKRKLDEEQERLRKEEEARRLAAEQERLRKEEEARRIAAEQERLRKEEEARRIAAEQELLRKEEEARRIAAEQERLRKEEEARRIAAEQERLRKEEEARRITAEQERLRKEEEARRIAAEQERLRKEEEARRIAAEQERLRKEEEARRLAAEQERLRKEEEARRLAEEQVDKKDDISGRIAGLPVRKISNPANIRPVKLQMVKFQTDDNRPHVGIQISSEADVSSQWINERELEVVFKPVIVTNRIHLYPLQTEAFGMSVKFIRPDWEPKANVFKLRIKLDRKTPFVIRRGQNEIMLEFER